MFIVVIQAHHIIQYLSLPFPKSPCHSTVPLKFVSASIILSLLLLLSPVGSCVFLVCPGHV